ncbi:MAG TPA: hypothetical protein VHD56_06435 [Tepidisphaeraceae bacterium]|nr:hypothetical protein [Tepidisphaeraceae bacterium]
MKRQFIAAMVAGLIWLGGCGAQPGKSIVKFESGSPARLTEAPARGTYALYSRFAANPDVSYKLEKGEKVGFVEEDGKIYAVAGSHKDLLKVATMGAYYWKQQE